MTSLGPLTTTFVPPPTCTQSFSHLYVIDGKGAVVAGPVTANEDCFPPAYQNARYYYYSPGICPSGYTPACSTTESIGTLTQTIATCCPDIGPTSFGCQPSARSQFPWETSLVCSSMFVTMSTTVTYVSDGITSGINTAFNWNAGALDAMGIQVRFQASDLGTGKITSTASSGASGATNAAPVIASNTSSNGLSTAATVGIGVGAAFGFLVLAGIILWVFMLGRRSGKKNQGVGKLDGMAGSFHPASEGDRSQWDGSPQSWNSWGGVTRQGSVGQALYGGGGGGYHWAEPSELPPKEMPPVIASELPAGPIQAHELDSSVRSSRISRRL